MNSSVVSEYNIYETIATEKTQINVTVDYSFKKEEILNYLISNKTNETYNYLVTKKEEILKDLENINKKLNNKIEKIIVIIIIERNRSLEYDILRSLIKNKERCGSSYKIVHVEQSKNCLFNRGLLANVGFIKAYESWKNIERIVVHDTDMFPESTMCYNEPYHAPVIHYATRVSQFNYQLPYKTYFGGAIGFIPSVYNKINGFSNSFWGWGGEDDDIYNRVVNTGFNIFSSASGRFLSTCHERDKSNVKNNIETLNNGSRTNDGLTNAEKIVNSIITKVDDVELHVAANVKSEYCTHPPPPPYSYSSNSYIKKTSLPKLVLKKPSVYQPKTITKSSVDKPEPIKKYQTENTYFFTKKNKNNIKTDTYSIF